MLVGCSIFKVLSPCGSNLFHRCMGNVLSTPTKIALKWSLNVLIAFSATICRCICGGTFCYSMPYLCIVWRNSSVASLSRMYFLILIPLWFILCISHSYALYISPDVLFLISSTRIRFSSVLHNTMMYLFL